MKLTTFVTNTARGFITYNGIGRDRMGVTPSDWLMEIRDMGELTLHSLAQRIKAISEPRIEALKADFSGNPRHSFVIAAYEGAIPVVGVISNYEWATKHGDEKIASPNLHVELIVPKPVTSGAVIATGDCGPKGKQGTRKIFTALKARRSVESITRLMVKSVRDSAYASGRKGTVGTSVVLGVLPFLGNFKTTCHIVGGSTLGEMPNFLSPQMSMRDGYVETDGSFVSRYDSKTRRGIIRENPCPSCGNPIPDGYARCGVCDTQTNS